MLRDKKPNLANALDEYQAALAMTGDARAFELLYRRWHPRLLRFAYRLVMNEDEARDLMQDASLSIASNIHRLEDPAKFAAWAYMIVRRRAADHIKTSVRQRRIKTELSNEPIMARAPDVDQALSLRQALTALPNEDRVLLKMFYLDDLSGADISQALGIPIGTVKSRLFAARAKLKSIYEDTEKGA